MLPMGATEQHGPHLPIGMDSLLADKLCEAASDATGVPFLTTLRITSSSAHTDKWPGTFSLSHETFIRVLTDIAHWSVRTGWEKLLLVNTHFGNDAPARIAVDQARTKFAGQLQIGLVNSFQLSSEINRLYTEDVVDLHANQAETALMMHLFPDLIHNDRLNSADDEDRTGDLVFSYPVSQTSKNGVTGFPSRATVDQGARLFGLMVDALTTRIFIAQKEESPLKPL